MRTLIALLFALPLVTILMLLVVMSYHHGYSVGFGAGCDYVLQRVELHGTADVLTTTGNVPGGAPFSDTATVYLEPIDLEPGTQ
jgi:hypothetical protein